MLIKINENGEIQTVIRQNENIDGFIQVEDNEELIINPNKFKYINNNLVKKYALRHETNLNFNIKNNYYELPIQTDGIISFSVRNENNELILLNKIINLNMYLLFIGLYKTIQLNIIDGRGEITIKENIYNTFYLNIDNDYDIYFDGIIIKTI